MSPFPDLKNHHNDNNHELHQKKNYHLHHHGWVGQRSTCVCSLLDFLKLATSNLAAASEILSFANISTFLVGKIPSFANISIFLFGNILCFANILTFLVGNILCFTNISTFLVRYIRCFANQTTRMPYSSSSVLLLLVTKNTDHFCSCCISQTWSNGFLQSFKQYFSPPDFDISYKKMMMMPNMTKITENAKNHRKCKKNKKCKKSPTIPKISFKK